MENTDTTVDEHVKVWKNIYSALDVSSTAIKDVLYDILSWSEKSQTSLKNSFAYFTSMMESVQLKVENNIEKIETRFEDAGKFLKERMDGVYDGLADTEEKLKDVQLVRLVPLSCG